MADLAPRDTVEATLAAVQGHLDAGTRVLQVEGPPASGRSMVVAELQERGALALFLPPLLDGDAVGHGVVQARRGAGLDARLEQPMAEALEEVGRRLAGEGRTVVMRLPRTWSGATAGPGSAHEIGLRARASAFLQAWLDIPDLQLVLVGNGVSSLLPRAVEVVERLPVAVASVRSLRDEELWGPLAPSAERLCRALGAAQPQPSPLDLRLAVGLVEQGELARRVAQRLVTGVRTVDLARDLANRLADRGLEEVLRRLLLLRVSVPVVHLSAGWVAAEFLPVLTHCLLHGPAHQRVRLSSPVRVGIWQALQARRDRTATEAQRHATLAALHRMDDGHDSPNSLGWAQTLSWLDKVHHLAHGGDQTAEEWSRQTKVSVDQLVDRAKALSVEEGDCSGAAALYRQVVETEPGHHYAWHYLGYNLDRLGQDREQTEAAYQRAIALDVTNPWYNSRLITSLVDQARVRDAETAWRATLRQVDPTGDRTERDPWVASQLHRWVAEAWLRRGEVKRARAVLDTLSSRALREQGIPELLHRLQDSEEAVALAESVRPPGMAIGQRGTTVLSERDSHGRQRLRWFAGRVLGVGEAGVEVVYAEPPRGEAARAVFREQISPDDWSLMSRSAPDALASPWFELGEYGEAAEGVRRIVVFIHDAPPPDTGGDDGRQPLRWLGRRLG